MRDGSPDPAFEEHIAMASSSVFAELSKPIAVITAEGSRAKQPGCPICATAGSESVAWIWYRSVE